MSAYVTCGPASAEVFRTRLTALVRNFDRDATGVRQAIREMLESDRERFYSSAISILREQDDSRGSQYIIALLVSYDLLLQALCDPAFTREQSLQLARTAARVDPMTDVALAKRLADSANSEESGLGQEEAGRVMEILSEISEGTRIMPSLMRLLRHTNPYVRSKAVKLVGRGGGSVKWVRSRLTESDPRIRANAIEALWGTDSEEVREVLQIAARDGNNRVAGNALIALYRLGDSAIVPELIKMSTHGSALFRSSAAWVMGETGDPRFSETLARMLREPNTSVRARAMSALGKIKAAVAQTRSGQQWLASALLQEHEPQKSARRLTLALTSEGAEHQKVLPTHILLSEDGKNVIHYKALERPEPEAISAVFLFPRAGNPADSAWVRGALQCLQWKRPSDLWAVQGYIPDSKGTAGAAGDAGTAPRYSANLETITTALNTPPKRTESAELWKMVWESVRADQGPQRGRRHMILFNDSELDRAAGSGLVSAVLASRAIVQVISTIRNPKLEEFCTRVRGSFRLAESDEAVAEAVSMAYLNLLARYEISYTPVNPEASALRIRISNPSGSAETQIALPPPAS